VLAHRLINTGDEDLKVACCWPTTAGHDYARVEAMPFPQRAYKTEEGEIEWK
jgi:glucose-6-phosphate isomerase